MDSNSEGLVAQIAECKARMSQSSAKMKNDAGFARAIETMLDDTNAIDFFRSAAHSMIDHGRTMLQYVDLLTEFNKLKGDKE